MQFFVKDGVTSSPVVGATVVVKKDADGVSVFSGTTDSDGKVDFSLPVNVAHNVLVFKTNEYEGVRVSLVNKGGVLYPASVSLLKVTSRVMKLAVFTGDFSTPLAGARVEVKNAGGTSQLVAGTGSDGKYQTNLQADLAGWTVTVTQPGVDGVILPLDKIDLVGEVRIVLSPVVD